MAHITFEQLSFPELSKLTPTPELNAYLDKFCDELKIALQDNDTKTGDIPYRGQITLDNLYNLFNLMPDLYEYLRYTYSAGEAGGDYDIKDILNNNEENKPFSQILFNNYIAKTYYNDYLNGIPPNLFSIDDWSCDYIDYNTYTCFPRKLFWWKDIFNDRYPYKEINQYFNSWK